MLSAAAHRPVDLELEVGAGTGRLTTALAPHCGRLIAYEVDPGVASALPVLDNVTVRVADFLWATPPGEPFSVVGNLPYVLTSPVVDWCLRAPTLRSATLLTQLEYARKRTGDYGRWTRLTVATWPVVRWRLAGRVPRTAFRPAPAVGGGILRIERRPAPLVPHLQRYRAFVDAGFTGTGGSLYASLSRRYGRSRVAGAFRATRLGTDVPVGLVSPQHWIALYRIVEATAHR